ncbi:hypothetical protein AN958_08109 [Leucoagaricus sp. SymC.cos]|nr:hypothetical protein AN958_08109 [Leucoagaricus sp. SymC.cos]
MNRAPTSEPTQEEEKEVTQAAKHEQKLQLRRDEGKMDHYKIVLTTAETTIAILKKHGISWAVFESLACRLYGNFCYPLDIDLLIIEPPNPDTSPRTAEEIKALIVKTDRKCFYPSVPPNLEASHRIWYYKQKTPKGRFKIDILIPGSVYLPNLYKFSSSIPPPSSTGTTDTHTASLIPPSSTSMIPTTTDTISPPPHKCVTTISGIPPVPFSVLLLHKLQGWAINRDDPSKRDKHLQDALDVRHLLKTKERIEESEVIQPWTDLDLFCEEFQQLTRERVKEYCLEFPRKARRWQKLGFETV